MSTIFCPFLLVFGLLRHILLYFYVELICHFFYKKHQIKISYIRHIKLRKENNSVEL